VLTNPPFGKKSSVMVVNEEGDEERQALTVVRDDFWASTSNKQLNFLQHVLTLLKPGGRCAIVVPDNVLFADQAGEVFRVLMEDCDVHTVLRCPRGTFAPYTAGTKTNVLFFMKGEPTKTLWVYDERANVPTITKKSRPLSTAHFAEFERCYGNDPNGRAKRSAEGSPDGRWRRFTLEEIIERGYKVDGFKWLRDDELDNSDEIVDPAELVIDAIAELQTAVAELHALQKLLDPVEVGS